MGLIDVKDPVIIRNVAFINIIIAVFGWILHRAISFVFEIYQYKAKYDREKIENIEWYHTWQIGLMLVTTVVIMLFTIIALVKQ